MNAQQAIKRGLAAIFRLWRGKSNVPSQNTPTEVFHFTCLSSAMNIYKTKIWQFSDGAGDEGMNLYGSGSYTRGNHTPHSGVRIVFNWWGKPALKTSINEPNLNGTDILYDQYPWRMFVGSNLSPNLMQIVRIELTGIDKDGSCHSCGEYPHVGWRDKLKPSTHPEEVQKLVDRTNKKLSKNKRFISGMKQRITFIGG
jgi:hypothetical protein